MDQKKSLFEAVNRLERLMSTSTILIIISCPLTFPIDNGHVAESWNGSNKLFGKINYGFLRG